MEEGYSGYLFDMFLDRFWSKITPWFLTVGLDEKLMPSSVIKSFNFEFLCLFDLNLHTEKFGSSILYISEAGL